MSYYYDNDAGDGAAARDVIMAMATETNIYG